MNLNSTVPNCKEIAQSIKGQKPPFRCPICQKDYKSITGIFYHIGQFGPPTAFPRCLTTEESQGSPQSHPSSPSGLTCSSVRRKARRELTWGEAQQLVEVEFDNTYRRVEIDNELEISDEEKHSTAEEIAGRGTPSSGRRKRGVTPRIQQKRGRAATKGMENETPTRGGGGSGKPAKLAKLSKLSSSVKDKCKRRSKIKSGKGEPIALPKAEVNIVEGLDFPDAPARESSYFRFVEQSAEDLDENVEYDMDEEDYQWLSLMNEDRKGQGLTSVPQDVFEILMDRLEKECVFESQTFGDSEDMSGKNIYNIDENAVCCICNDGECHNTNAILFCDMCNLAIHQECYGVPYIPEGQWLCRRCIESPSRGVDCALCPNKGGAFKQTLDTRWAHVICAIWIPEVQFANPVFLEPIDGINEIPPARWKLTCYICRRRMGACIQCAKANCYVAFHVTCAQQASLYMKLEPTKGGEVKKTAFCDAHTPPSIKRKLEKEMREQERSKALEDKAAGKEEEVMVTNGEGNGEKEGGGGDVDVDTTEKKKGQEVDSSSKEPREEKEGREERCTPDWEGEKEVGRPQRAVSSSVIKARKMMEERIGYSNVPVVNIPYVPHHRLGHIIAQVNVMKKSQFVPKLVNYWKLKRQSRNGVPLLRRLQANKGQRAAAKNLTEKERGILVDQLALWNSLRHDLERARLLIELVRKREKLKREKLRLLMTIGELQIRPINQILRKALERISRKDPAAIFANPVTEKDVPDYFDIIRKPMDFLTMANKVEANEYSCLEDFEKDFKLVWHNATIYNQKDTIYYKAAIRVKEAGQRVLEQAKLQVVSDNIHSKTGLHQPEVEEPPLPPPVTSSITFTQSHSTSFNNASSIDVLELNDDNLLDSFRERRCSTTSQISLDEQVDVLQEKLQMIQSQPGYANRRKEKTLRKELSAIRRQIKHERKISETDDHNPLGSPSRRHRAASIPRNAEELACHLIHGSLRFTPSRQQILSYSGIRLEERASAMRKQEVKEEQDLIAEEKERIRLHSSSDSMLLLRSLKTEAHGGRVRVRMRSSEPVLAGSVSNEEANRSAPSLSSSGVEEEDVRTKKWKLSERKSRVVENPGAGGRKMKKKKKKKKKKTRHKDWKEGRETCNSTAITVSSTSPFSMSSQSKRGKKSVSATKSAHKEKLRCYVVSLQKSFKCKKASAMEGDDEVEEDEDEDSSFSVDQVRRHNRSQRKVAESPTPAKTLPKQVVHHTRLRSETLNAESELEGSGLEVKRLNGSDIRPRKSERLNPLNSPTHEGFGMSLIGRQMRTRSKSSSVYETAGEPDNSATEEEEERRRRNRKRKRSPCLSDSEVREEVFSEEVISPPPSASSFKDLTVLHVNDDGSGFGQLRQRREHKRKQSQSSDDPFSSGKKQRMNSESSDRAKGTKVVVLNGMVLNGEGGRVGVGSGGDLEIRPMELVWAKCCGYPPYPALVIDPDIPDSGLNVHGEHILPPSDEVMVLKEKNPTHTYLVRFFDGRRTWQWLPPEKIESLGVSQEKDNAKISMAGTSKRSVKEAYARAKHWQQRKERRSGRGGGLSKRSNTLDSEASSRNTGDPDVHNSDVNVDLEV